MDASFISQVNAPDRSPSKEGDSAVAGRVSRELPVASQSFVWIRVSPLP